jgi:hypothetical protein
MEHSIKTIHQDKNDEEMLKKYVEDSYKLFFSITFLFKIKNLFDFNLNFLSV